jgi:hypothetical protein
MRSSMPALDASVQCGSWQLPLRKCQLRVSKKHHQSTVGRVIVKLDPSYYPKTQALLLKPTASAGHTMNRKAELLEERKKKWSASRSVSDLTEQVTKEAAQISTATSSSSGAPLSPGGKQRGGSTDAILHRLTDKLTEHIRLELQKEMQSLKTVDVRESVAQKMDSYLEAELSTHTCKICFELMTSPVHTPILLFPCGHTFCLQCTDSHMGITGSKGQPHRAQGGASSSTGKTCPYCRTKIESRAVNQSLKDLIDQFSKQKQMVWPLLFQTLCNTVLKLNLQTHRRYRAMPSSTWKKFSPPAPAPRVAARWALRPAAVVVGVHLLRITTTEVVAVVALLAARCRTMPRS